MKLRDRRIFQSVFLTLLFFLPITQKASSQTRDWAGVWGIWGENWQYSNKEYPWYVGSMCHAIWEEVEPEKDRYDFTALDQRIETAVKNGLNVMVMMYIAPDFAPEWLYLEGGVEKVISERGKEFPWYFDPDFKREFKEVIKALADHIDDYPPNVREKVVAVQAMVAKSGDPQPWNSEPVDPKYQIEKWWVNPDWRDYCKEMFTYYYDCFKDKDPEIYVMMKPMKNLEEWMIETLPRAGRKAFSPGQGYHLCNEKKYFYQYENLSNNVTIVREEFDVAIRDNTYWLNAAPEWNVYWTSLWALTYGLDIWNQRELMMNNPDDHIPAFEFFTEYARYKDPASSPGAWIAFRDDLDGANLKRFPESEYGPYRDGLNPERNLKIARQYEKFGAKQDDPEFVAMEPLSDIHNQKGLNDVVSGVWRGNYRKYLYQIKANETSQGYWSVGSKDERFGRFARGFNYMEGKNAIYLDIDNDFFDTNEKNTLKGIEVRIIYYDSGKGEWELRYDAIDDHNKLAGKIKSQDSGRWSTVRFILNEGLFLNNGPESSDLSIINCDKEDNIFHMVEIRRL
jgi:hypothetical protein